MLNEGPPRPIDLSETFQIDDARVKVNSRSFFPNAGEIQSGDPQGTIIFLPGWGVNADSRSAGIFSQSFADAGNQRVLAIDTKPDRDIDDSLFREAQAIGQFVRTQGVNDLTIVGFSEGGSKAADLSVVLQDSDVKVDGVILINPIGMYKQKQTDFFINFIRNARQGASQIQSNDPGSSRQFLARSFHSMEELLASILREALRTKGNYPKRLVNQVRHLARRNKRYADVNVPVILLQGTNDVISDPKQTTAGLRSNNFAERERQLQRTVFTSSPHVRMLAGDKPPFHNGPILRSGQVARVSLFLLRRAKRKANPSPSI